MNTFVSGVIFYISVFLAIGIIAYYKDNYKKDLKYILSNIVLLYKNFFHWNISKIIILFFTLIIGFIISSPLIGFLVFLLYMTSTVIGAQDQQLIADFLLTQQMDPSLLNVLYGHIWLFLTTAIVIGLVFSLFGFAFYYGYFLQQNLYKNYLEGKKLANSKLVIISTILYIIILLALPIVGAVSTSISTFYIILSVLGVIILLILPAFLIGILKSENRYLDYKLIWKYLCLMGWIMVYLMIPVGIGLIYLMILAGLSMNPAIKDLLLGENPIVTFVQTIITGIIFLIFIYTAIRLSFAYIAMLESSDLTGSTKKFLNKSLAVTKGKIWYIFWLGLPFVLISTILDTVEEKIGSLSYIFSRIVTVFDFILISGISYMIYVSIYKILTGNTANIIITLNTHELEVIEPLDSGVEIPVKNFKKPTIKKKTIAATKTKKK